VSVSRITKNSVIIKWQTNVAATSNVIYGLKQNKLSSTVTIDQPQKVNSVTLKNLPVSKNIYFQINSTNEGIYTTAYHGSFKTPSSSHLLEDVIILLIIIALLYATFKFMKLLKNNKIPVAYHKNRDEESTDLGDVAVLGAEEDGEPLYDMPTPPASPMPIQPNIPSAESAQSSELESPVPLEPNSPMSSPPTSGNPFEVADMFEEGEKRLDEEEKQGSNSPDQPAQNPNSYSSPAAQPLSTSVNEEPIANNIAPPAAPLSSSGEPAQQAFNNSTPVPVAKTAGSNDIPDMFEEGNKRLDEEEKHHLIP